MKSEPIVFLSGQDEFLVKRKGADYIRAFKKDLGEGCPEEIISGNAQNVADVQRIIAEFRESAQMLSLFAEQKIVWLQGVNFISDTQTGKAEDTKRQIEILQNTLNSVDSKNIKVLITAFPVDRRRKDYKAFKSISHLDHIEEPKDPSSFILTESKRHNLSITLDAIQLLASKAAGKHRVISNEIDKLAIYLHNKEAKITEQHILELVPEVNESDFFETTDAFYSGNTQLTLEAIDRYFFNNKESRPLIAALQNRNRLMIQIRTLLDSKKLKLGMQGISKASLDSLAEKYSHLFRGVKDKSSSNLFTQNPWYLGKIAQTTKRFSLKQLIQFQVSFVETFENILTQPNDQKSVIQKLAITCLP